MNPFDLRGPQFLLFYAALSLVTFVTVVLVRRAFEAGPVPKLPYVDPYLVACLRGGSAEAVRVMVLSLLDRGLLEQLGDWVRAVPDAAERARRPIERAVLARLAQYAPAAQLPRDERLLEACSALSTELERLGLFADVEQRSVRGLLGASALACLWLVTATKVVIALMRGHHNLAFLLMLSVGVSVALIAHLRRPRTPAGDGLLADLRTLFEGLQARAALLPAGGASNELSLLLAVFGLSAADGSLRDRVQALFPEARRSASGSATSNSGSSCGSSCGSGCGGGGGCGGCGA